ncbi:hypothetical protein [Rhodococcus marinonascens]|uniref:hypothetical protein n=1 Tax=Rhodococcus marinonascens TaxID=38311 RepID=UPI000932981D|nr:hypothetical protein [Rhodococcus marinonascens]
MRLRKNEVQGLTAGLIILVIASVTAGVQSHSWATFAYVAVVGGIFGVAALAAVRLLFSPKRDQPKKKRE